MSMHETQGQGRSHGRGGPRGFLAASLCVLAASAHAGDHDRCGVRVNTGMALHAVTRYLILGAAVDVPVSRAVTLVADGQLHGSVDTSAATLAAGVRVQPWHSQRILPYVTAGAGLWAYDYIAFRPAEIEGYAFAGVGVSLRVSRALSAFGEIRTRPLFRRKTGFDAGTPVMVGVRLGL